MDLSNIISELTPIQIMVLREALANYNQTLTQQIENCTIGDSVLHDIYEMYKIRKNECNNLSKLLNQHDGPLQTTIAG